MIHITIMSAKLDESVAFYQEAVGLEIIRDNRGTDHPIAFLCDEGRTVSLEIAGNPNAFEGRGIALGFEVDDIEATRNAFLAKGYKPGPILSPDPHAHFFFMNDPNGVNLQFVHES